MSFSNKSVAKFMIQEKTAIMEEIDKSLDCQMQSKNFAKEKVNLISKSGRNVKDSSQESYCKLRKNVRILTHFSKKEKKGVDFLLGKLENCSKKIYLSDSYRSIVTTLNEDERDTNNRTSFSSKYSKSRSPNHRENDVISPNFSNEDSNDTKQKRKRKLGKPIRLSKDKWEQEEFELNLNRSKLENKPKFLEVSFESNQQISHDTSSTLKEERENLGKCFDTINIDNKRNNLIDKHESQTDIKSKNDSKIINLASQSSIKHNENPIVNSISDTKSYNNYKINVDQHLVKILQSRQYTRIRRHSESTLSKLKKKQKKRRKSCDDANELLHESFPKITLTNNVLAFNEVEYQLEKMFAGIIETDQDLWKKSILKVEKLDNKGNNQDEKNEGDKTLIQNITESHLSKINYNNICKNKKKKVSKLRCYKKKTKNSLQEIVNESMDYLHKTKKKRMLLEKSLTKQISLKKSCKNLKIDSKDVIDSSPNTNLAKLKGPIIQIKGSRNNPMKVEIMNIQREDDEEKNKEKRKIIGNGIIGRSKRLYYQNNFEYFGKGCNAGLFNSTLSVKYDAQTTDATWICVFCKKGPHYLIPGNPARLYPNLKGSYILEETYMVPAEILSDLFGPYLIKKEFMSNKLSSYEEQDILKELKQESVTKSFKYTELSDQYLTKFNKTKNKSPKNVDNYYGMTFLDNNEPRWEVWIHEQCIIWAAGVYITGGRVSGLEDAVWDAVKLLCDFCGLSGANIGCTKRGCKSIVHYCCALISGWDLDSEQYIPKCKFHKFI